MFTAFAKQQMAILMGLIFIVFCIASPLSAAERWTAERANVWYDQAPWPVGTNFVPSTAINPLEMWQAETFDPETIDRELGWAADISMNSMRVYLHDLAYRQDPEGFLQRVDQYLAIAEKHGILTMFVLFDGVWNPYPKAGKQPAPVPRVHNSGWVQSPGREILDDPVKQDSLKPYVQAVIARYQDDPRVFVWDLFNEPDNANGGNFGGGSKEPDLAPQQKKQRALELLTKTFAWAREIDPSQPLTAGVWGHPNWLQNPDAIETVSLENSDVISFHTYNGPQDSRRMVEGLLKYNRPILCTEYMARSNNSTFEGILPIFHEHRVGAYNWGLVDGKSQTIYPWSSWKKKFTAEPDPWFHDVFRRDGRPYSKKEVALIRELGSRPSTRLSKQQQAAPPMSPAKIKAGFKSHDQALFVKSGWIRDPFITLGPDGYYVLTGTTPLPENPKQHSDPYNLGLGKYSHVGWKAQVWRSHDLITWESLDCPFTLEDGIWKQTQPKKFEQADRSQWRLWAPELHWIGERWALVHTSPAPVKGANLSLTPGVKITRPWDNPMGEAIARRHDPSLFKNDDGTWWMIWGATEIAPLKPDFSAFAAQPTRIGPSGATRKMGHEGCLIHKIGETYVLFGTGWSTGRMRRGSYNLYYATADKITGPYSERKFVGRFLGHGTPFQDKQGRWWCTAFFNANVPPLSPDGIKTRHLGASAYTINQQGVTLVPLEVHTDANGELIIRAKDPAYGTIGPDEAQDFGN